MTNEQDMDRSGRGLTRRRFLLLGAASTTALALAACGGAGGAASSSPASSSAAARSAPASPSAATAPPAAAASPTSSGIPSGSAAASPSTSASTTAGAGGSPAGTVDKVVFGSDAPPVKAANPGLSVSPLNGEYFWASFDGLTWVDRQGQIRPGLASEWKNVQPAVWEFKLRQDVKFHDGSSLEAADVVGSFNYYANPENKLSALAFFSSVAKVEAADASTVRITLKAPTPTFPKRIALPT